MIELGLLDYPSIVKKPMDFSTIKVRLSISDCHRKDFLKANTLLMMKFLLRFN